jgi:hypothetical protein
VLAGLAPSSQTLGSLMNNPSDQSRVEKRSEHSTNIVNFYILANVFIVDFAK